MAMTLLLALALAGTTRGTTAEPADGDTGAGPAYMVADLSSGPSLTTLNPAGMVTMGGAAYFSGQDDAHGVELWRSDGTEAGTRLVLDLRAGPGSSTPGELTSIGSWLYFVADDGRGGVGLWRSDGTAAGTELLQRPFASARPTELRSAGGLVVFALGTRLMVFEEGVGVHVVRKDLCGGEGLAQSDRSVASVENGGATYYLVGCNASERLWRTDGTRAGTFQVAQLGSALTYEPQIVALGGTLYLTRNDGSNGELWRSDGTPGGTSLVSATEPGLVTWLTRVGARLFFMSGYGTKLYVSDGTPAGTALVKAVEGGQLTDLNGTLLMSVGTSNGFESLWRSDGTGPGTFELAPLKFISGIHSIGGRALVYANRGIPGPSTGQWPSGLWSTDGTAAGTQLLAERPAGGCWSWFGDSYLCHPGFADLGGVVLFRSALVPGGGTLWRTDGTEAGTEPVFAASGGQSTWPSQIVATGDRVFFTQDQARLPVGTPRRLYVSDGTSTGTSVVREWPDPSNYWSDPEFYLDGLTAFGTAALFYLSEGSPVWESRLWRSDGSAAGTQPLWAVTSFLPYVPIWRFGRVPPFTWNGRAYFPALSLTPYSWDLLSTDGSAAGTLPLLDLNSGGFSYPFGTGPQLATAANGLFVSSGDAGLWGSPGTERELWRSEGGADPLSIATVDVLQVVSFAGAVYFVGQRNDGSEFGLWRSDGTTGGTQRVTPLPRASAQLTVTGARLYFVAPDAMVPGRRTLWTSDGTAAGTQVVLPGGPLDPEGLTAVGSSLFFSALQAGTGREPWCSDGTAAGTLLVKDLLPGPYGSILEGTAFNANAERVYFAAEAPGLGRELWSSDGTPAGTQLVQDIAPGPASSNPDEPTVAGSRLYFRADDGTHGAELWALPITPARQRQAASTALPRNAQARMAADEAEAMEALRQIGAAANGYVLANGAYPTRLSCMGDPSASCPGGSIGVWPPDTPAWLPPLLGALAGIPGVIGPTQFQRAGYLFSYVGGVPGSGLYDLGVNTFTLAASPLVVGATGQRFFITDQSGRICQFTGPFVNGGPPVIEAGCTEL